MQLESLTPQEKRNPRNRHGATMKLYQQSEVAASHLYFHPCNYLFSGQCDWIALLFIDTNAVQKLLPVANKQACF